jgi:hypothetical protein
MTPLQKGLLETALRNEDTDETTRMIPASGWFIDWKG